MDDNSVICHFKTKYVYIILIVLHNGLGKISTHKFFVQETWYEGYAIMQELKSLIQQQMRVNDSSTDPSFTI